jgi:hypothetical protein
VLPPEPHAPSGVVEWAADWARGGGPTPKTAVGVWSLRRSTLQLFLAHALHHHVSRIASASKRGVRRGGQCRRSARAVAAENLGTLPRQELFSQLLVLSLLLLFSHFGIVRRHACGFCPPLRFLALNAQRCFAQTRPPPCRWCASAKRLAISAASSG